jgi:Meckel syndrome type 1 protein
MNTERTLPTRPAALNDRSSAPAERRPEGAFAALLDAVAPAPRREEPKAPRTDATPHREQPAGTAPEGAPADAGTGEQPQAADRPVAVAPVIDVPTAPVALPEAAAPAPAAPVLPTAPIFMLAPEAVVAAPVAPQPPVAAPPAEAAPVAVATLPGAPVATTPAAPAQPAVAAPAEQAAADVPFQADVAPAPAPAAQATAPEARKPAEPVPAAPAQVAEAPAAPEAPAERAPAAAPAPAAAKPESAPAPAPAAAAPVSEPVAGAPAPAPVSHLAAPERAVPLHRAPAAVSTLLHVAVERGISHAKMALRPAELGGIEIRLQATAGGVAAQVVADSPEAARLLAQAGDDLRRALEARDVTLISLEVSTSGDQQQQSARGEWTDGDDAAFAGGDRSTSGDAEADAEPAPTTQTVIELPGGLLVDVLA